MFYEPSEIMARDKVSASSQGCCELRRLRFTPEEDALLALTNDPVPGRGIKRWIDPHLAAVYIIGNSSNNLFKVGYARDLRKRFLAIQGSSPVPVSLVHFVYVVGSLVAKFLEADLHAAFDEERRHGEWFEADPTEVAEALAQLVQQRGYVWWDEKARRELGMSAAKLHLQDWERYGHRGHAHD